MATERAWPDIAIPPGEVLAETLEARRMTQAELARRMGRPAQAINEIIQGAKEITPETALQLERVLGIPAHVWTRLEADYRYVKARLEDQGRLKREVPLLDAFPYAEMVKLGWIPITGDPLEKVERLLGFFGLASLRQVEDPLSAAFRKSSKVAASAGALAAWLRQGERKAAGVEVRAFDERGLREGLRELRSMTLLAPQEWEPRLTKLLGDQGVALVLVHHLPKTGAHGATRWLGDKAVLQMSHRYKWEDVFWFTLFHELAHVLLHSRKRVFIELDGGRDGAETEANEFANDQLLPARDYLDFTASGGPFTGAEVVAFARRQGIAPSIVVGRLHHDNLLPWSHLNDLRRRFEWADE